MGNLTGEWATAYRVVDRVIKKKMSSHVGLHNNENDLDANYVKLHESRVIYMSVICDSE